MSLQKKSSCTSPHALSFPQRVVHMLVSISHLHGPCFAAHPGLSGPRAATASVCQRTATRSVLMPALSPAGQASGQPGQQTAARLRPLLSLVVDEVVAYEQAATGQQIDSEDAIALLQPRVLVQRLDLFQHVNRKLRGRKFSAWTSHPSEGRRLPSKQGISFLDLRGAAGITHPDSDELVQGVPYEHASRITCVEAAAKLKLKLQYPWLPCVAAFQPKWADPESPDYRPGGPQDHYRAWPLELCVYDVKPKAKVVQATKDADWPDVALRLGSLVACCADGQPLHRVHMPDWLVDWCLQQGSTAGPPTGVASTASAAPAPGRHPSTNSPSSSGSSSSSTSTSSDGSTSGSRSSSIAARAAISNGFKRWTEQLCPDKAEKAYLRATVTAVCEALQDICKGQPWTVQVLPAGSHKKKTSLRGSRELDIVIQLHTDGSFTTTRTQCLGLIHSSLCSQRGASAPVQAELLSGWEAVCYFPHYLHLYQPKLQIDLDLQVAPDLRPHLPPAANGQWRLALLDLMIQRAAAAQGASSPPPSVSTRIDSLSDPSDFNKDRCTLLTPLLADWLASVQGRFLQQYGQHAAGCIATTVIRALKAWVREGLGDQLQPPGSSSRSAGSRAARPPGFVCEVFVVYVLEQQLMQHRREAGASARQLYAHGPAGECALFMDVLLTASQLLRPSAADSTQPAKPIAVTHLYTEQQCEWFRGCWGLQSSCTPFIIHPADPSYNCKLFSGFERWAALADAAGELHQQMQQLMQQQGSGDGDAAGDAWEAVVASTTLGRAVEASRSAKQSV